MNPTNFPRMHVSLYVSDLHKSQNFYTQFFGQNPSKIKPGYLKYELTDPALIISFIERPEGVKKGFGHLGFQVGTLEELLAKQESFLTSGMNIRVEQKTNCCYALQDKFWVSDPDGYQWELYFFHNDVEFNDPHHEVASGCCAEAK